MIQFSYTVSIPLKENLDRIEQLRTLLLLSPLPHRTEIQMKFDSTIDKIYWSLSLSDIAKTKKEIAQILTAHYRTPGGKRGKINDDEKAVLSYKQALDFIDQEWYVNSKPVSLDTLTHIHGMISHGRERIEAEKLTQLLSYLAKSTDHPIIQAAFVQMQLILLSPFSSGNGRLARLMSQLFLYKYGYDFRGLLVLDEFFRRDLAALQLIRDKVTETMSLTSWLEYYSLGVASQLERMIQKVKASAFRELDTNSFTELNDRHKQILLLLEDPDLSITNKKVQKHFHVSQITASRDLAKLATLGLLIPHGKGRSIFYTRA